MGLPACDVRDVALAHVKSLYLDEVVDKRHLLLTTKEPQSFQQYAKWLSEEFTPKGYKISTKLAPNMLLKLVGMFDKRIAFVVPILGKSPTFDNSRYLNTFGIQPYDPRKSMIEMAYTMIEKGFIPKKY